MTNSVIPYSFVPGTKAKASEVNANFAAIVDLLDQTKDSINTSIQSLSETTSTNLTTKADKSDLDPNVEISEAATNLDDYKTAGTYYFSGDYTPQNIPSNDITSGTLIVIGKDSNVKQIWFADGDNIIKYSRRLKSDNTWTSWYNQTDNASHFILRMENGGALQWGYSATKNVTYPIAFESRALPIPTKYACTASLTKCDTGIITVSNTGFQFETFGTFGGLNYIAMGY